MCHVIPPVAQGLTCTSSEVKISHYLHSYYYLMSIVYLMRIKNQPHQPCYDAKCSVIIPLCKETNMLHFKSSPIVNSKVR